VELAAYFCCLEALHKAAKHAGRGAVATVRLSEDDRHVRFTVSDDGVGFNPRTVRPGAGLANMTDRLSALGGTLRIESIPGRGTSVAGEMPT
jgi:signal transduction histidine kinase